jgi:hypothetical protein
LQPRLGDRIVFHRGQIDIDHRPQELERSGTLHGDHCRVECLVDQHHLFFWTALQFDPGQDLHSIRRIDHQQPIRLTIRVRKSIEKHVVENAAAEIADESIADLSGRHIEHATRE